MKIMIYLRVLLLAAVACIVMNTSAMAQSGVAINSNGAHADTSAILDVSSTTKGMLIPRMTQLQRNAIVNPAEGLIIYNTTSKCLEVYIPSTWQDIYCGCSGAPATPGTISGTINVCSGQSYVYSIAAVSGATTYTWTVPSGATITGGQGTISVTILFGSSSGNIAVTDGNNCGTSPASSLAVTVNPGIGNAGAITGPTSVSSGQSGVVYSISPVTGANSYTWTVPTGASITAGQGTTSITVTFGSTTGNVCVTPNSLYCGSGNQSCTTVTVSGCPPGSQTFTYTGGLQTFTVPSCITSITVVALGAKGGGPNGGPGGQATATIVVIPNEVLNVYVGGQPLSQSGSGGYNGGGNIGAQPCGGGTNDGWPGGGASDVRRGTPLANRLIVAGGGGGQGWTSGIGGSGGGLVGTDGQASWIANTQGLGGTQSAGGLGGNYSGVWAPSGTLGIGGDGAPTSGYCIGGAGGGGYYGGGGGYVSAGGGGSSFVAYSGNTNTSTTAGVNSGNGQITISW